MEDLRSYLDQKFEQIDKRLERVDARLGTLEDAVLKQGMEIECIRRDFRVELTPG